MKILYYNNCWFTNVGEAFIDIGARELLQKVNPDASIANISNMPHFYHASLETKTSLYRFLRIFRQNCPFFRKINWETKNSLHRFLRMLRRKYYSPRKINAAYYFDADFEADILILPGMFACKTFVESCEFQVVKNFSDNGTKIIFLGMGGTDYSQSEIARFSSALKELNIAGIITRDNRAYEMYKDCCEHCYPGIDCAFFVGDAYNPGGFAKKEYDVVTFNRMPEPETIPGCLDNVIRPYHMQFSFLNSAMNITKRNVMISDTPYDYLTVYANAHSVYTDLVHATIASLVYDVPVKYYHHSQRSLAFEAAGVVQTKNGVLRLSRALLDKKKQTLINNLKNILSK